MARIHVIYHGTSQYCGKCNIQTRPPMCQDDTASPHAAANIPTLSTARLHRHSLALTSQSCLIPPSHPCLDYSESATCRDMLEDWGETKEDTEWKKKDGRGEK
ncbi:UNVERIFIED_CONTAM: hypothetical protein K2H54_032102 [Gekko kuhli]